MSQVCPKEHLILSFLQQYSQKQYNSNENYDFLHSHAPWKKPKHCNMILRYYHVHLHRCHQQIADIGASSGTTSGLSRLSFAWRLWFSGINHISGAFFWQRRDLSPRTGSNLPPCGAVPEISQEVVVFQSIMV